MTIASAAPASVNSVISDCLASSMDEGKGRRRSRRKRHRPSSWSTSRSRGTRRCCSLTLVLLAISWKHSNSFSALTSSSFSKVGESDLISATSTKEKTISERGEKQKSRKAEACDLYKRKSSTSNSQYDLDHHQTFQNSIPLWLQRYYDESYQESSFRSTGGSSKKGAKDEGEEISPLLKKLQDLETLLTTSGFSLEDKQDVLQTMFYYCAPAAKFQKGSSASETALLLGMIDFVHLIVAEHGHFETLEDEDDSEGDNNNSMKTPMHCDVFASKPVILAGIAHYAESVLAIQNGIYDRLERSFQQQQQSRCATGSSSPMSTFLFPPLSSTLNNDSDKDNNIPSCKSVLPIVSTRRDRDIRSPCSPTHQTESGGRFPPNLPESSRNIASSAAAIKRAEILARTIMGVGSTRRLSKAEAEGLQGLLLSSMDDWRALALRCIASLFRLEGILYQQQNELLSTTTNKKRHQDDKRLTADSSSTSLSPVLRSPEVVHTAQEAIMVYGTLAQRLGMHQLKAKIEEKAFQILYQRQYRAVSSVYEQNGNAMQVIRSHLSTQIDALLRNDEALMTHIETLEVSSRVKEPFSFWKKLLKTKAKQKKKRRKELLLSLPPASSEASPGGGYEQPNMQTNAAAEEDDGRVASNLSFAQVQDGIALRVILKAKKEAPDEPDETTRAREKLLCYYVQHLIRKQWPGDEERVKDYIQFPKPNGYQSLHYTAWLTYYTGQHFPFEVQVRSEEMHRIAEYGVAAHWDYKLAAVAAANDDSESDAAGSKTAEFALKAAVADGTEKNNHPANPAAEDESLVDVVQDDDDQEVTQPEVVVGEMLLSSESVMTTSLPSLLNGNTPSPATMAEEIIDSEAAAKYEALLNEKKSGKNAKKNSQFEYIDALVTAKQTLRQQRVYVFVAGSASLTMEQGQLLVLDSGSSIRDALRYMKEETPEILQPLVEEPIWETSGNFSCRPKTGVEFAAEPSLPVWRNGKQAQMDDIVQNGDVLLLEL